MATSFETFKDLISQ